MALHVFATVVTPFGVASNNRGENDGNISTLQKLLWHGSVHSSVSAESIRFALRRVLLEMGQEMNRTWSDASRKNEWKDAAFREWGEGSKSTYVDDDLLGFMATTGASEENSAGSANVRRSVLEVTRAVSLTPWVGDITFNAASPGATPGAQRSSGNPVPYGTEFHGTRYQFSIAMTPAHLRDKSRAALALRAIGRLGTVAGNQGRFLYDFAPESIILRVTDDPAPRILYCFDTGDGGKTVHADALLARVKAKSADVKADELLIGGGFACSPAAEELRGIGAFLAAHSVGAAVEQACKMINDRIGIR